MPAEIEWVVGVLRVGSDFEEHGDPYEFSCTVNVRGEEAELIGGIGEVTPRIWRDIRSALLQQGVQRAHWRRINGVPRNCIADGENRLSVTFDSPAMPPELASSQ